MSFGFHYYEAMNQSLALQWFDKKDAAVWLGRVVAVGATAQLVVYAAVFLGFRNLSVDYATAFAVAGGLTLVATLVLALAFPRYPQAVKQHAKMVLRQRYWLYYALTFMYGARRQIFTVFAGFMMVTKFKFAGARDGAALSRQLRVQHAVRAQARRADRALRRALVDHLRELAADPGLPRLCVHRQAPGSPPRSTSPTAR